MKNNNLFLIGILFFLSLIGVLFFLTASASGLAQPSIVEQTFEAEHGKIVELNLKFGDQIIIHSWNRPEISFRATFEVNGGKLNDALLIDFNTERAIRIDVDFDKELIKEGRAADCPDKNNFQTSQNSHKEGYVICSDILYEIHLPPDADLHVESISADIELVGLQGPVRAKSISGFVDMSWMERNGAEVSLKSISGGVYTDLENIEFYNKKKDIPLVGYEIKGKIGNGGAPVRLESISGDIYLRAGVLARNSGS